MKIATNKKILFGYGAAFLLLLIAFSYSIYNTNQLFYHIKKVGNTNKILNNLESLKIELKQVDPGINYERHSNIKDLKLYFNQHFKSIDSIFEILEAESVGLFRTSKQLSEIKYDLLSLNENLNQLTSGTERKKGYTKDKGDTLFREVTDKITAMLPGIKALLIRQSNELYGSTRSMKGINIAILIIALLLAGYSWTSYRNENIAKNEANARIVKYSKELENKVSELSRLNKELIRLGSLQKFTYTGRIARMIAHEVRNPLTNINLSYDQLKELTPDNDLVLVLLNTIKRNSDRINKLIGDLLNVTKAQDLNLRVIAIKELLEESLLPANDRITLKDVRIVKHYDVKTGKIKVDVEKIKIAFLNIILNAVEAMPPGKGILTIGTSIKEGKCVITISDNGRGMDDDTLEKIFDPYFTSKSKGNGLGLTNTQNIIIQHKGALEVESQLGDGTTFTIVLDLHEHTT